MFVTIRNSKIGLDWVLMRLRNKFSDSCLHIPIISWATVNCGATETYKSITSLLPQLRASILTVRARGRQSKGGGVIDIPMDFRWLKNPRTGSKFQSGIEHRLVWYLSWHFQMEYLADVLYTVLFFTLHTRVLKKETYSSLLGKALSTAVAVPSEYEERVTARVDYLVKSSNILRFFLSFLLIVQASFSSHGISLARHHGNWLDKMLEISLDIRYLYCI